MNQLSDFFIALASWCFALLFFPGFALGLAAIIYVGHRGEKPRTSLVRGGHILLLIGVVLTYLVSLAYIFNGATWGGEPRIVMQFPGQFHYAWLTSMYFQFAIIPPLIFLSVFVNTMFRKRPELAEAVEAPRH